MQALRCAWAGTRASSSDEKCTFTHQQVVVGWLLSWVLAMAHRLGLPHKGQAQGSGAVNVGVDIRLSVTRHALLAWPAHPSSSVRGLFARRGTHGHHKVLGIAKAAG